MSGGILRKIEIYVIPIFLGPFKRAKIILLVEDIKTYFILLGFL